VRLFLGSRLNTVHSMRPAAGHQVVVDRRPDLWGLSGQIPTPAGMRRVRPADARPLQAPARTRVRLVLRPPSRDHPGTCASCGIERPLIGRDVSGQPVCGPCAGDHREWTCQECGQFGALFADQRCRPCVAQERLRRRLRGPDGTLHPQLSPLLELVDVRAKPRATLTWLHTSQRIKKLGRLAASNAEITHTLLDQQPPTGRIVHLRAVLTYAGVLPARKNTSSPPPHGLSASWPTNPIRSRQSFAPTPPAPC
jgi:hypothetical protein